MWEETTVSNIQAVGLALIPGAAEIIEERAIRRGNMAWDGMAKGVIYARNALYTGIAITTIGIAGVALSEGDSVSNYASKALVGLGVCYSSLASKKLYDATLFILRAVNSREQQG